MRPIAAAWLACLVAGCATQRPEPQASVVRARPPSDYQTTITSYFDVHVRGPQTGRRLAFAPPESSKCALRGTTGAYKTWMVPVIYETSAQPPGGPRSTAATKTRTAASGPTTSAPRSEASGTARDGVVTLDEVQVSGKGYFFWFTRDTISAVTRRADRCP
jgi:hypothetical protein